MQQVCVILLFIWCSLHTAISLHVKVATHDSCDCVGYQDAFKIFHADCSIVGFEACNTFIMRMPNEQVCMNEYVGKSETQWCYVSSNCAEGLMLQWSSGITPSVKWKYCAANERSLGQMTMIELADWCEKNDMDLGLVAAFAYPMWTEGKLPAVWSFWGASPPAGAPEKSFKVVPISDTRKEKLQAQIDSGKPMFFDSPTSRPPFAVSEGKALYYINFGTKFLHQIMVGADFFAHPGIINEMKCVVGCDIVSAAWWTPINNKTTIDFPAAWENV